MQRDRLLREADQKIRDGLKRLGEQFPLIKDSPVWATLSKASEPGRINIILHHPDHGPMVDTTILNHRYGALISIMPPPKDPGEISLSPIYPDLGLAGHVDTRASNPELEAAMKQLVAEALAPLQALNDQAAAIDPQQWHLVAKTDWAAIQVERRLYETPGSSHFFIRVRLTNLADHPLGVDLRDPQNVVYPNQWGMLPTAERLDINERRALHKELDAAARDQLLADFRNGKLTAIAPGKSLDYWRAFNASGRADMEKQTGKMKFMFISLDGETRLTDGRSVRQATFQFDDQEANTDLFISVPVRWENIPRGGRIVGEDSSGAASDPAKPELPPATQPATIQPAAPRRMD